MNIKRLIVGPIQTNCYIVSSERKMAIIDPGDEAELILENVSSDIKLKYIICTHYHFDHTTAVGDIKHQLGGEVLMHKNENAYTDIKVDRWLKDLDKIQIGNEKFQVILTPGHTRGSFCLLGENAIFTGDTLFQDGYGRTDLDGGSEDMMIKSLDKLRQIIKPGMAVYPGHGNYYIA